MKIVPTPPGGLALHLEFGEEWSMLTGILRDARTPGFDLVGQVGGKMAGTADAADWAEFVLPDLREGFDQHLKTVLKAIETARFEAAGGPGTVSIPAAEMFDWYATLNQARLALEARYHFGTGPLGGSFAKVDPERLTAYYRSQFYCAVQSHLLDYGME
jgi:hypothetical protein